jgi:hypothetical protein
MLILLRQLRTGENPTTGIDIYEQKFFNSSSTSIVTNTIEDGMLDEYEMATGQLVFDTGFGNQYVYNGSGGVTFQTTPGTPTYELLLIRANGSGTIVTDSLGFFAAGASVSVTTSVPAGQLFERWTRLGIQVSTAQSFTYTMPAANTVLQARFIADDTPDPVPVPEPVEGAETFYPLELRIRGIQIPMPPFVQRQFSNMFDAELQGDYSYAVNIPLSPREMAALGLPNDPQGSAIFFEPIPASIWAHGNLRYRGHLDILKADEERIRCSFILDSGFFIQANQELKLPACYDPTTDKIDLSGQTVYAVGGFELRFNYRDVRLTVNTASRNFLKAEYPDHISMLEGMLGWLNGLSLGLRITVEYSEDPTDETSKLIYWDTTTITTCTLVPVTGTSRFTRARKLTSKRFVMEPWNQFNEANRIAFPTIYNRNLYEGNNALHDGIVNRYDEAGRLYVSNIRYLTYSESFRWEHCIIPFLYLTDVVKQIFKKLKIAVSGEFFDSDLVKRMLLYNNRTLDFVQVAINGTPSRRTALNIFHGDGNPENESYFYENVHDLQISLANHVPAYSVVEFLKGLKNYFGLKYDFNLLQNRVEIRFAKSKLRERTVLDLTAQTSRIFTLEHGKSSGIQFTYESPDPLMQDGQPTQGGAGLVGAVGGPPPPGGAGGGVGYTVQNFDALLTLDAELFETAYVQSIRAVFTLTPDQSNPPFWKLTAWRQQSDVTLSGVEGSPPSGGVRGGWPLTLYALVDVVINGRKMPGIEVTANNPEVNLTNTDTGLRIMAFYGQEEDSLDRPYAFASCTRYNAKEILDLAHYDLDIRSLDIAPLHADVERILTGAKLFECTQLLDEQRLFQLSKSPIIRIANIDYAIADLEVQSTDRDHALCKSRLYKIK